MKRYGHEKQLFRTLTVSSSRASRAVCRRTPLAQSWPEEAAVTAAVMA